MGVGPHSGDPHYEPKSGDAGLIREGSFVLVDLWGKLEFAGSVYADITWVGYTGQRPPERETKAFGVVCAARDAAVELVLEVKRVGKAPPGLEVAVQEAVAALQGTLGLAVACVEDHPAE